MWLLLRGIPNSSSFQVLNQQFSHILFSSLIFHFLSSLCVSYWEKAATYIPPPHLSGELPLDGWHVVKPRLLLLFSPTHSLQPCWSVYAEHLLPFPALYAGWLVLFTFHGAHAAKQLWSFPDCGCLSCFGSVSWRFR